MADIEVQSNNQVGESFKANKKHILLNAFDMSTVGHLSPGQWKVSQVKCLPFIHYNCPICMLGIG